MSNKCPPRCFALLPHASLRAQLAMLAMPRQTTDQTVDSDPNGPSADSGNTSEHRKVRLQILSFSGRGFPSTDSLSTPRYLESPVPEADQRVAPRLSAAPSGSCYGQGGTLARALSFQGVRAWAWAWAWDGPETVSLALCCRTSPDPARERRREVRSQVPLTELYLGRMSPLRTRVSQRSVATPSSPQGMAARGSPSTLNLVPGFFAEREENALGEHVARWTAPLDPFKCRELFGRQLAFGSVCHIPATAGLFASSTPPSSQVQRCPRISLPAWSITQTGGGLGKEPDEGFFLLFFPLFSLSPSCAAEGSRPSSNCVWTAKEADHLLQLSDLFRFPEEMGRFAHAPTDDISPFGRPQIFLACSRF